MVHWVKLLATKLDDFVFKPQDLYGGRRGQTPTSCHLVSCGGAFTHTDTDHKDTHTYMITLTL